MRRPPILPASLVALMVGAAGPACAQVARSGGGESQRIMQQYQQVAAEKTALQAQLEQMKKDLESAKIELAAAKKERDALKGRSAASPAAVTQALAGKAAAEQQLEQSKQRMSELVQRFRETAQSLKEVEADRTRARKELADGTHALDACAESNLQLYEITEDVLKRYENVGLFTRASATEPFTRLTRTRIENLVDQYRARAQDLRVKHPGT